MSEGGPGACRIVWWGHATVEVRLDGARFVTDPLLRRRVGPLRSTGHRPRSADVGTAGLGSVDAVLLSHLHRDHTDLPSLRRFPARTRVVGPRGSGRVVHAGTRRRVEELSVGEQARVGSVQVTATWADHDGRRHPRGPVNAQAVGFLLSGSQTVYFAGDTDLFDEMADIGRRPGGRLDVALLPVSGWGLTLGPGHMDAERAAEAVSLLRPRLAVPIHWGTLRVPVVWRSKRELLGPGAAERFATIVAGTSPGTVVAVPVPGRVIETVPMPNGSSR